MRGMLSGCDCIREMHYDGDCMCEMFSVGGSTHEMLYGSDCMHGIPSGGGCMCGMCGCDFVGENIKETRRFSGNKRGVPPSICIIRLAIAAGIMPMWKTNSAGLSRCLLPSIGKV